MKMNFKRLIKVFVAIILFIPITVFATDIGMDDLNEARANNGEYTEKGIAYTFETYTYGPNDEYEWIEEYFLFKSGEYKLLEDLDIGNTAILLEKVDVTFDLNEKSIIANVDDYNYGTAIIAKYANLVLKGNGSIPYGTSLEQHSGKTIIENGTYNDIYANGDEEENVLKDPAYLTINNGVFTGGVGGYNVHITINDGTFGSEDNYYYVVSVSNSSTLTINGGTFKNDYHSILEGYSDYLEVYDEENEYYYYPEKEGTESRIIINGGKFISRSDAAIVIGDDRDSSDPATGVYYEINGGTFEGRTGGITLYAHPKYLTIRGGTFKATGDSESFGAIMLLSKDGSEFNKILAEGCAYEPALQAIKAPNAIAGEDGTVEYISQKEISVKHLDYKVLDGSNQAYDFRENKDLSFRFSTPYSEFLASGKILINGKEVDSKYYTATEGSTIITFNKDYVKSNLKDGDYKITIVTDFGEASTSFKVIGNPDTVDNIIIFGTLFTIALAGTYVVCNRSRKYNN